MSKRYRVIVWAPGHVGSACLRELLRRPEFDVVGVFAYSEYKNGKDVGELIDHAPIGVKVTTNRDAIFALRADCVLWAGAIPTTAADEQNMNDDVIRLLESGKNVVSVVHHYPPFLGSDYTRRIEAACRKGNSSLHGTGENPGFWFERVALTLTAVCTEVRHLRVDEYLVAPGVSSIDMLHALGFGRTIEDVRQQNNPLEWSFKRHFFVQTLSLVSQSLFARQPDDIAHTVSYALARQDIVLSKQRGDLMDMTVSAGRVSGITHEFVAVIDGKPRLTAGLNWYMQTEDSPGRTQHYWSIEIEGRPTSLRCGFSAFASLQGDRELHPGDPTTPTIYATAALAIQTIPVVCESEPGIVYPTLFTSCVPDLTTLANRKSVIG
ncbi:MAG: hypothetical protein ABW110_21430 [Steroidobacteraceae bacterium]